MRSLSIAGGRGSPAEICVVDATETALMSFVKRLRTSSCCIVSKNAWTHSGGNDLKTKSDPSIDLSIGGMYHQIQASYLHCK